MSIILTIVIFLIVLSVLKTRLFSSEEEKCFRRIWAINKIGNYDEEEATYRRLFKCFDITFDHETHQEKLISVSEAARKFDLTKNRRNLGVLVYPLVVRKLKTRMYSSNQRQVFDKLFPNFATRSVTQKTVKLKDNQTYFWRENLEIAPGIWVSPKPDCITSIASHFNNYGLIDLDFVDRARAHKYFNDGNEPFTEAAAKFREMIRDPFSRPFFSLCDLLRTGRAGVKDKDGAFHVSDEARIKWFRIGAEAGNQISRHWLINSLSDVESNSMNIDEAIKWLEIGVAENDFSSVTKLSEIYAKGIGVEKDLEKSEKLNELAEKIEEEEAIGLKFD